MCKEKRSFFQVVDMSGNEPKTKISFNPTVVQFWAMLFAKLAGLVVLVWGLMLFAADWQFQKSLKKFHEDVRPGIIETIESEVSDHASLPAHEGVIERITAREIHDAAVDEKLIAIETRQMEQKTQASRIESKIDRLLEGNGG